MRPVTRSHVARIARPAGAGLALALVASVAASAALGQGRDAIDPTLLDPARANIEAGLSVVVGAFAAKNTERTSRIDPAGAACFQCHGIDGKGDGASGFPRLTGQVYKYLVDSLRDYASGARENAIMSPIARALTVAQMRDVSAYYATRKDARYGERPAVEPQVLQLGAAIAAVGAAHRGVQGCINCHGPDGVGLPPTYPYLAGQNRDYLEAQLRAWKTGARRPDRYRLMARISARLTDAEIRAVSAYYASLRPDQVTPHVADWRVRPW